MKEITHISLLKFFNFFVAVIFVFGMIFTGGFNLVQAEIAEPVSNPIDVDGFGDIAFDVKPDIDMISGWEWPPDTEVTIFIPAYSYSQSTTSTSSGDVDFPPLPVDIQVGDYVEMSDGTTTKYTTVVPLEFGGYSMQEGTVRGTAEPYAEVWGFVCPRYYECGDSYATADGQGNWELDFSVIGINPGSDGGVYIWDEDGDATSFFWSFPYFSVIKNDKYGVGVSWSRYSEVDVFVDGIKFTTGISDEYGLVVIPDLDVRTDQKVKFTDGKYTKVHKVRALKLTSVDPLNDKVKGTADPGSVVTVAEIIDWGQEPAISIPVTTSPDGTWVADFANVGWDITHASFGNALICDNDGDCTEVIWEGPPDDINPDYGEKLTTSKVTFDWPDEVEATQYKIQLSTKEDFSTLVLNVKTDTSSYAYDVKLLYNTTYYWRIRPFFGAEKGNWSAAWMFFSMDPLASPILVSPAHKELVTTNTPTFNWQPVVNAASYLIQLSTSSLFETIFLKATVGGTEFGETMEPLPDGKYYWRVRAIDTSGGKGPWSEVRIVKVDAVP